MSLKERLLQFLKKVYSLNPNQWTHKSILEQRIKEAGYLADNGTRRLRELVEDDLIEHRAVGNSQEYRYSETPEEIIKRVGL